MTKKKKIILSSIIVGIILAGIIATIILVNIKRFDIKADNYIDYNKHTQMTVITHDSNYTYGSTFYKNGTEIISKGTEENNTVKKGIYSYFENRNILEPIYSDIKALDNSYNGDIINDPDNINKATKTYFLIKENTDGNKVRIVDEKGNDLSFLNYDSESKKTTSEIKTRTIDLKENNDSVKSKVNKKYHNEKITITSANLVDNSTYKCSYHEDDLYTYEVWELKTTDNLTYYNLYKIEDDKHILIQTLNNELGVSLESRNLQLYFLTDGTPMFLNQRVITYENQLQSIEYEIYDINFNLKGKSQLNANLYENTKMLFKIGNYLVFQIITDATEEKYDYFDTSSLTGITKYYSVNNFKLNMKNGDISEFDFNYIINSVPDENQDIDCNSTTALISARLIKNKKLTSYENLLINEKMQTKKLNYSFNTIKKINDNRYIAYTSTSTYNTYTQTITEEKSNFNLIDRNYNIIAHLDNFTKIYCTSNAIMVQDESNTYICNYDGVVIKKISNENFFNIFDAKNYVITKTTTSNGVTYTDYYLEELGLTSESPICTVTSTSLLYGTQEVSNLIPVYDEDKHATLLIVVEENGNAYDYVIYNAEGTKLGTITGMNNNDYKPDYLTHDDSHVLLKIDQTYVVLDR